MTGQIPGSVTVVGNYDLLNFNTVLVNQSIPATGVACHTAPVCSVFTLASSLLSVLLNPNGLLTGLDDPSRLTGPAVITADYQYSPVSYFDPYLFYYGCVVADANGAASVGVDCTITATGFNTGGQKVYSQDFEYKSSGKLVQDMTAGYFNQGWSGLKVKRLELTVSNNATTAALFDNFLATVYGPQNAATTIDFKKTGSSILG